MSPGLHQLVDECLDVARAIEPPAGDGGEPNDEVLDELIGFTNRALEQGARPAHLALYFRICSRLLVIKTEVDPDAWDEVVGALVDAAFFEVAAEEYTDVNRPGRSP